MMNRAIGHLGAIILSANLLATPAFAESADPVSTERAILILDASGSMWGQIDGAHKITIARDVIQGLLDDWEPTVELGLTAYGHREKGNCADIETLAPVGPMDKPGIMAAIDGLNPKGKTPLADAVRQAAETLRYTEERATVILVSDGKETCDADPCAVAKELDANGIDFTTHVVGFDLTEEEKVQLQCIADNTGGKFLSANNAAELHEAMATTVQLVAEPEPAPKRVVKVETTPIGTLSVQNVTSDVVYVYEPGEAYSSGPAHFSASRNTSAQLSAGTYMLGTPEQEITQVDIAPGEETVVDMKDFFGWLSVQNVTGDVVYVYEPGEAYSSGPAHFSASRKTPAQLRAGTYMLGTPEQELTTFEIQPGEELVIELNN